MGNPIRLDTDEAGISVTILLDLLGDYRLTGPENAPETVRGRISMSAAWELYEHIQDELGEWYAEGAAVQREFKARAVDIEEAFDPLHPKHPSYADNLRELADISRKAEKENRP